MLDRTATVFTSSAPMLTERAFRHCYTDLSDDLHKTTALCQADAIDRVTRVCHIHIKSLRPSQGLCSTSPMNSGCVCDCGQSTLPGLQRRHIKKALAQRPDSPSTNTSLIPKPFCAHSLCIRFPFCSLCWLHSLKAGLVNRELTKLERSLQMSIRSLTEPSTISFAVEA